MASKNFMNKVRCGLDMLKYTLLGKRTPAITIFSLTDECPGRCDYCEIWRRKLPGLPTERVFSLLTQMKKAGTKVILFTGGDPLCRKDIGKILDFAKKIGLITGVLPCLVGKRIDKLNSCDTIYIPLLGPPDLKYRYWNEKVYNLTVKDIKELKNRGIEVEGHVMWDPYNVEHIDFLIDLSAELGIPLLWDFYERNVMYQENDFVLDLDTKIELCKKLLRIAKSNPHVASPPTALDYLINRYSTEERDNGRFRPPCIAPKLFAWIDTDGRMFPCQRLVDKMEGKNVFEVGFDEAFRSIPGDMTCKDCVDIRMLELSFMASLNLKTFVDVVKKQL